MKILVVEDDKLVQAGLRSTFKEHSVVGVEMGEEAVDQLERNAFNIMFLDLRLKSAMTGLEVLQRSRAIDPLLPVVVMSGLDDKATITEFLEEGIVDYFVKGTVNPSAYTIAIHKASVWRKHKAEELAHAPAIDERLQESFMNFVGSSSATDELRKKIEVIGKTDGPFLIIGETGTGKELAAHAIWSVKRGENRPFIIVNCAEFQGSMIEGELFGYEKGAFTGAANQRVGLFEASNGGDIFLDEIGELPLDFQAKLLRVLQTKRVRRVGSNHEKQLDFRVIAATNRNLQAEVKKGTFREDLFYRLDVHSIFLTPLRERADDIERLLFHFFEVEGLRNVDVAPELLDEVRRYSWPGNVRQLIGFVKFVVPMVDPVDAVLTDSLWNAWLLKQDCVKQIVSLSIGDSALTPESIKQIIISRISNGNFNYDEASDSRRRLYVETALELSGNNQAEAARLLGISKQRLQSWLTE